MSPQDPIARLVSGSKAYAGKTVEGKPDFFKTLAGGQSPEVLWIGCADSRVPETTVCDCGPGDIFVHRNIANIVHANDFSVGSVIDYAVDHLKVKHIVICGHTKCGGAAASLGDADLGDNLNSWLKPLRELRKKHQAELDQISSADDKAVKLAELNVKNGLEILRQKPTISRAIESRGLGLQGLIYDIGAGELKVLS
jgi:carbonic anhydrase